MPFKDPDKARAASKRHYEKHGARVRAAVYVRRRANKETVRLYKERMPCSDCHKNYPYYVMDFDHIPTRGKKATEIGKMLLNGASLEKILAEIEKCDLVCSNCHRIRTHKRHASKGSNPRGTKK